MTWTWRMVGEQMSGKKKKKVLTGVDGGCLQHGWMPWYWARMMLDADGGHRARMSIKKKKKKGRLTSDDDFDL